MVDLGDGFINNGVIIEQMRKAGKVNPIAKYGTNREFYARGLEIRQRQQFLRKYRWSGLPKGLSATMIERILYYRGRVCFFKIEDTYFSTPFTLNGSIDLYGRYRTITPLTFNGSISKEKGKEQYVDGEFIQNKKLNVCYDIEDTEDKDTVILDDYTKGISETVLCRYEINKIFISTLADIIVLIRHNLIASARIYTVRCLDEGQKESIIDEFANMEQEILENGKRIFPITGALNMDEVLKDKVLETQQYWECFVSLDNLRENLLGIENNGIFKKKERVLKGEQELEAGSADLVYSDGLYNRQDFCDIFNKLFGENVWCEESEVISGTDVDGDNNIDDQEGSKEVDNNGNI